MMDELHKEIGMIKGKQEMVVQQLSSIEQKLDRVIDDIATVKSKVSKIEGRASVWGIITAAITTALINLGLRR
ncbi:MAG: hypothetical protein DRG83_00100 [Deltaproteobacteria bacterium]|nr:MAG: hypothetical protein DRG83_00100 [Deltaproteobacteria bacterium]